AAYVAIKVVAVARRSNLLVSPEDHYRFINLAQEFRQVATSARRIKQNAASGGSTFSQCNSHRGATKGVTDENYPGDVNAPIDNLRLAVNQLDNSRQGPAVAGPRTVIG